MSNPDDDADDDRAWQPVCSAHTPLAEVEEAIVYLSAWSLRESTVVVNNIPNVSPELRARILAALADYIPAQTRRAIMSGWERLRAGGE